MLLDRRRLLIGGGAALGLVVAWTVWPRRHAAVLPLADGEHGFGGWLKIGVDGHVTVAVPQCEHGQGAYTALPQIVADELGADWRTVGVEAAPESGLYANPIAAEAMFGRGLVPVELAGPAPMLTGASSSIRMFEAPLRQAGAAARALLCRAAAARHGGDWRDWNTAGGFVVRGERRLRFGELAADAAGETLPDDVPPRLGDEGRLAGTPVPRLDAPSKVDGSANFAGDVRLPNMVFASVRGGPLGDSQLVRVDRAAADRVPGVLSVVETPRWVAAIGTSWWAANRGLGALAPRFETRAPVDDAGIARALAGAIGAPGHRVAGEGDVVAAFANARVQRADYRVAPGLPAAIEPVTATASYEDGKLVLWLATQAPGLARAAAARAAGIGVGDVVLHPMVAGGSFGANLEVEAAEQAALLAVRLRRPVQLTWSRAESLMRTPMRAPALARMTARAGANGAILGWHAAIAAPSVGRDLARRLLGRRLAMAGGDPVAVDGAAPVYRFPAWAVDHHPADVGLAPGWGRGGAHVAACFATESFLDELAHANGVEPLSFRIGMLGGAPRLARCLSTVASLGGWQGGVAGSGQGIAAHAMRGSFIALMVEGAMADGGRPRVERMVAAVDVGRAINPDLVRQAIEGGLIYGLAGALGASTAIRRGLADARSLRDLALPMLGATPDILVELIESDADPGGASELAVPVVAPALANAIFASSGRRIRKLPL